MCKFRASFVVPLIITAAALNCRADDGKEATAIIDKAMQALGGEAKLSKMQALTARLKGTFHGMGAAIEITGDIAIDGHERNKFSIEGNANGQKFRVTVVLNRDKGWLKFNDLVMDMDKDAVAEAREQAFSSWVAGLTPLKDKKFRLSTLGEVKIGDRPALGVKVASEGHRDVDLYFDKETFFLVKSEYRVKDDNGQEVTEESLLSDYKEVEGTKQSAKLTIKRDGKPYLECEMSDWQFSDKLDDSVFAKP